MRASRRSSFLSRLGRDVGDRLDRLERVGALLIVARVLARPQEARAQHRDRRRDAVELEVVLRARRQRLAVLVELVVGQAEEDAAVAVLQRLARRPTSARAKMYGVQSSREIDQRVAGRLGERSASIQRSCARRRSPARAASGGRSSRGFSASASLTVRAGARGASADGRAGVPEAAAAPVAGVRLIGRAAGRGSRAMAGRSAACAKNDRPYQGAPARHARLLGACLHMEGTLPNRLAAPMPINREADLRRDLPEAHQRRPARLP